MVYEGTYIVYIQVWWGQHYRREGQDTDETQHNKPYTFSLPFFLGGILACIYITLLNIMLRSLISISWYFNHTNTIRVVDI